MLPLEGARARGGGVSVEECHTYRICEFLRGDKKPGRPKRLLLHEFKNIPSPDLAVLRKHHEGKLGPTQYAELDGKIVARGSQVTTADEQSEPVLTAASNDQEALSFSNNLLWDVYGRCAETVNELKNEALKASAEIRAQTAAMNEQVISNAKMLDGMLDNILKLKVELIRQSPAPQAPAPGMGLDADTIKSIVASVTESVAEIVANKKGGR